MSEIATRLRESINPDLVVPDFDLEELRLSEHETSVHLVHRWFEDLFEANGIVHGRPLVLDTPDDNKAVWIWREIDTSRERNVEDTYHRGSAYVSPRKSYNVGIVAAGSFMPEVIFSVGKSSVGQDGNLNLQPLASDEASCDIFVGGEWEHVRGAVLRDMQFYKPDHEWGRELRRQDELAKQAVKGLIDYIS